MVKVKICGITSLADARNAVECGADILGFNFYKGSRRYVDEGYAESIVERLQSNVLKAGVFVNHQLDEIVDAEGIAELDILQLHGDEDIDFVHALRTKTDAIIIKAFRVGPDFDESEVVKFPVDGVLLDSYSPVSRGGTGMQFDWAVARSLIGRINKTYLAGGLTPDNVADAVRTARPYAVDVASGVESSPGKKDPKLVEAFIKNAKNA
ncbi:MAG: phosphoribosylanthranilate isomerase [Acidobacteria bacterium]|nr:phosphoribosylanthranilate isomerase [Acidobacteriota bacterium]